jgi:hypothetical protein
MLCEKGVFVGVWMGDVGGFVYGGFWDTFYFSVGYRPRNNLLID